MNRVLILIGGVALMGILFGCGQDPAEEKPSPLRLRPLHPRLPRPSRASGHPGDPRHLSVLLRPVSWHRRTWHGINAPYLTVPPRDHTKADYLETRTDEHLFTAIQQGGLAVGRAPCMPSWQHTLDENTIHSLVSYIRELCQCEAL